MFEELHLCVLVGFDGGITWLPVSRADFTIFVCKLESLNQSQSFINASSNSVVVDLNGPNSSFRVNNEETSKSSSAHSISTCFNEDTVVFTDLLTDICKQRIINLA